MNKILIAYDGSTCADAALEDLGRAGLPDELEATVISVAEVWGPADAGAQMPAAFPKMTEAIQRAHQAAWAAVQSHRHDLAERAADRLRTLFPRWRVAAVAVGDTPAWAIVKEADRQRADLVVVGSRGCSVMERLFLGSVSHKVAIEASCSVRICRPHHGSGTPRIIVAVDGSPDACAAVHAAAQRLWPSETLFQVAVGLDSRLQTATASPNLGISQWMDGRDTDPVTWVSRAVNQFAGEIQSAGWSAEPKIFEGEPKHRLLRHAEEWQADCIFLGAHGLDHGERRSLGSFASAVATRAHCSVEIVRERASTHRVAPASADRVPIEATQP
jgi:nucleotide-binding universal stress UspA family protein